MTTHFTALPGAAAIEEMALRAFSRIPEPFAPHLDDLVVRIEDFAAREVLDDLGLASKWQLSGLYHGHSLDRQSIWSSGDLPSTITLYRMPILAEWRNTGVDLEALVAHVVIHEVGHHFGLSDADMAALEREAG